MKCTNASLWPGDIFRLFSWCKTLNIEHLDSFTSTNLQSRRIQGKSACISELQEVVRNTCSIV